MNSTAQHGTAAHKWVGTPAHKLRHDGVLLCHCYMLRKGKSETDPPVWLLRLWEGGG
jgi:hypothetical protein